MSFHTSSSSIRVEDRSILKAMLRKDNGEECHCEMDLNRCIGNDDGHFQWGGENFALTANPDEPITCNLEGGDQVPVLRACLQDAAGNYHWRDINLGERIGNNNGEFCFSKLLRVRDQMPSHTQAHRVI
ncbi:hypothetical protein MAPG_09581 [Magnaporthiopsis poae ATCC 64411]|uniref:Cyanovirin-N domain-containing protein n=1 Tax=Magnaporthiopsis poae (strain ATCC 64411 / 73-15) TaxID=644358 RepID=A0A0C4CSJ2_MAGP6|nr:hypothetical protein, variant [Magnaporthiopsis poae ATCC 64411]KLU91058.1 hypothetical protein MAPG_09581 [Magnaporthiopsis poae ATCC 64411]